ncbi:MAG: hypothetical protein EBU33_08040 [Sphingobacteriia bacterium]|jgi:hypothetical protein|nr:hypothetical protein [Sphingobacteriia bacterium]
MEKYGQTRSEKLAEENSTARKIVREISQFGVSDRQRYLIMYYLCMELEDMEKVKAISSFLQGQCPDINITSIYEGEK